MLAAKSLAIAKTNESLVVLCATLIPLLFAGPQLLVGTLVNGLLFIFAWHYPRRNCWPIIILPSLGAVAHGLIFGPLTPLLIYFLPFIWLGNWLLIKTFIFLKKSLWPVAAVVCAGAIKSIGLYAAAIIYFKLTIVPAVFIQSMGMTQFTTALLGGITVVGLIKIVYGRN